jgi:hypothetical protein
MYSRYKALEREFFMVKKVINILKRGQKVTES